MALRGSLCMIYDLVLRTPTFRAGFQFQIGDCRLRSKFISRGNGPELLLVILSGLSEVLRDSIKNYVFWSSWWV